MDRPFPRRGAFWITLWGMLQVALLPAAARAQAAPARTEADTRRVLLVHGIYNSGKYMGNLKRRLEARGCQVWAVSLRPNDASVSFEAMAAQLEAFVNANFPPGEKFDLVGFSMGGLVGRYYIQKLGGYERVRRFVTISAPNHGTIWAWLSGRAGVKEMRPGSALLRELNGDVSKLEPLDYTSIYTPVDLTIVPPSSSRMPFAHNVVSWVPFHAMMVWMPGPIRAVERALE